LFGVDYIQPHPQYRYTKKLIVLTNELDFSAGDFFPAILQDSGRAIIMGSKTAGAGGYVLSNADRNRVGVMQYTYTGSHALRADGKPLEDNGVTPDVPYGVTPEDLKTRFLGFRIVINAIVSALINI
jgi:C-terminal processing protease CtpA/Prc